MFYRTLRQKSAFTLVELMIVVSILGIMAAIVLPELQGHTQKAKESGAKSNLRTLRTAIERYAVDHNGIAPGYPSNNTSAAPDKDVFIAQLTTYSAIDGQTNATKTGTYSFGPYLTEIPTNPYTDSDVMVMVPNAATFPNSAYDMFGWIYKPASKEIRVDYFAADSEGKQIFEY